MSARLQGSIIDRGEDRWLVRVYVGDDGSGRRRYHNHTVRGTKRDAQRYLTGTLRTLDLGTFAEPARVSVDAYLDRWLETAAKPRVRPRTFQDYTWLLKHYVRPKLGAKRLDRLRPLDVQGAYAAMGANVTALTVQKTHRVLSAALVQAVRWGLLAQNPAAHVALPRDQRPEMRALTAEEADRFVRAADELEHDVATAEDGRHALRQPRALVFVFTLATGMRPGEVLALRWEDLDLERGTATVRRNLVQLKGSREYGEPKTRAGRRVMPLPASLTERLRAHRRRQAETRLRLGELYEDEDLVFAGLTGRPLDPRNLTRRDLKEILLRAGLPAAVRWYDLRHTCATLLLAAGENVKVVSERLGHAKTALTLDLYAHVLPGMQERAASTLEGLLFTAR